MHQPDIFAIAMVVIAGDIATLAFEDQPWRAAKTLPDGRTGAIGERRTFNLIGRGRSSPQKPRGELTRSILIHQLGPSPRQAGRPPQTFT